MCIYRYIYIYLYTHIHTHTYKYAHICVMCVHMNRCLYVLCVYITGLQAQFITMGSGIEQVICVGVCGIWCVCVCVCACACVLMRVFDACVYVCVMCVFMCVLRCMSDRDRYVRVCVCVCVLLRVLMSLSDRDRECDIFKCVREGAHRLCVGCRETVRHQGGGKGVVMPFSSRMVFFLLATSNQMRPRSGEAGAWS